MFTMQNCPDLPLSVWDSFLPIGPKGRLVLAGHPPPITQVKSSQHTTGVATESASKKFDSGALWTAAWRGSMRCGCDLSLAGRTRSPSCPRVRGVRGSCTYVRLRAQGEERALMRGTRRPQAGRNAIPSMRAARAPHEPLVRDYLVDTPVSA